MIKLDRIEDAQAVFDQAKTKGVKGDAFDQLGKTLAKLEKATEIKAASRMQEEPSQKQVQPLIDAYARSVPESLDEASLLLKQFPNSINLLTSLEYQIIGWVIWTKR